jgi:hypothetical protein
MDSADGHLTAAVFHKATLAALGPLGANDPFGSLLTTIETNAARVGPFIAGRSGRLHRYHDSYASPSGLATTTVYPSGSRIQISRCPGPLPWPSGGLRYGGRTNGAPSWGGPRHDAVEVTDVAEPQ